MYLPTTEADFQAGIERGAEVLWGNPNPGRALNMGRGEGIYEDTLYMVYIAGGRSEGSQDRDVNQEGSAMRLVAPGKTPEEMAKKSDAALVYYTFSDGKESVFVVSNGAQTSYVLDAVVEGEMFEKAVTYAPKVPGILDGKEEEIDLSSYEPDLLNTPRITGVIDLREGAITQFGLAVVRKDPNTGEPIRSFYIASLDEIPPGRGWGIQTYGVNDPDRPDEPVPPFNQVPYVVDMSGDSTKIAERNREAVGSRIFSASVVRAIGIASREFRGKTVITSRG